jgi:tetratricopeptide (TPR) repeat protein
VWQPPAPEESGEPEGDSLDAGSDPEEAVTEGAVADAAPDATSGGRRFSLPQLPALPPWARDRRVMMGAGGLLLLVVIWVGMRVLTGQESGATEPLAVEEPAVQAGDAARPASRTETEPAAVPAAAHDMTALMREAEAAFESEDYAAAVIAYDRVLKEEPGHAEAEVRMKVAADRYREQQARQERWDRAVRAFESEHFSEALRLFYRMPAHEYEADIERYKVNGWYNLGVAALKAKDCGRAVEHFEEARAIAPRDEGVVDALDLAELCRSPAVYDDVKRLGYRALND